MTTKRASGNSRVISGSFMPFMGFMSMTILPAGAAPFATTPPIGLTQLDDLARIDGEQAVDAVIVDHIRIGIGRRRTVFQRRDAGVQASIFSTRVVPERG